MQLTVFDLELEQVGILYTWVSLVWRENYRDVGAFQLEVQRVPGLENTLKPWRYCTMTGSDTVMLILSVQINENTIIANGTTALHILTRRISTDTIKNENAESAMLKLVTNMSSWPLLEAGEPSGLSDKFERQTSDGSIFEYCKEISNDVDMGFRIVKRGKKLLFECYKPEFDPNIRYFEEYGNISNIKYTVSDIDLANVAVVAGQGSGDARITVTVGAVESTGADRLEIYRDARDIQQEEDESMENYLKRLENRGLQRLADLIHVESLDFTPYNDIAKLGDLINVKISSLNLKFSVRVMEVEIVHQRNRINRKITVGTPMII